MKLGLLFAVVVVFVKGPSLQGDLPLSIMWEEMDLRWSIMLTMGWSRPELPLDLERGSHFGWAHLGLAHAYQQKGTPMRPENWLRRRIKPVAAKLGIVVPVNFQVLRRTFATNAQNLGSAKDVQTHLRHADIATTLGVYTQPLGENVRKLVNAVADDVMTAKKPEPRAVTERVQ